MPGSPTAPDRRGARAGAPRRVAFRLINGVGVRDSVISRLNGWPVCSPADASPLPSRADTHGSGPMRIATPSSQWTCTTYSLPVSRRTNYTGSIPLRVPTVTESQDQPNRYLRRFSPKGCGSSADTHSIFIPKRLSTHIMAM